MDTPKQPLIAPPVPPAPPQHQSLIPAFCLAVQSREGYYGPGELEGYPNGTPAYFNHNPGNLRCIEGNKENWNHLAINGGTKHSNFCVFPNYVVGMQAFNNTLRSVCLGKAPPYNIAAQKIGLHDSSFLTIRQFFLIRDPASDGNDPESFAQEVATKLGVSVGAMMKELL